MTTSCAPGCGRCCDPVQLMFHLADVPVNSPSAPFIRRHWREYEGPQPAKWDGRVLVHCDAFDPDRRVCTVHDVPAEDGGQPPICSDYPRYGLPPGDPGIAYGEGMDPACSYNADVRTFLPIVEVR